MKEKHKKRIVEDLKWVIKRCDCYGDPLETCDYCKQRKKIIANLSLITGFTDRKYMV